MACGMSSCGPFASVVTVSRRQGVCPRWCRLLCAFLVSAYVCSGPCATAAGQPADPGRRNEVEAVRVPSPLAEALEAAAEERENRLALARAIMAESGDSTQKNRWPKEFADLAKTLVVPSSDVRPAAPVGPGALGIGGPDDGTGSRPTEMPAPVGLTSPPTEGLAGSRPQAKTSGPYPQLAAALHLTHARRLLERGQVAGAHAALLEQFKTLVALFPDQTAELLYRAEVGLGRLAEAAQTLKVSRGKLASPDLARAVTASHLDFIRQIGALKPEATPPELAKTLSEVMDSFARTYPLTEVGEAAFAQLRQAGAPQAELIRRLWPTPEARRSHALDIFRRLGNKSSYRAFALALGDLSATVTRQVTGRPDDLSLQQKAKLLKDAEWFISVREYEQARGILEELAPSLEYGRDFAHDKLLFLRARCANATSRPEEAALLYAQLFKLYPSSPYAAQAQVNHLVSLHLAKRHDTLPGEIRRLGASNKKLARSTGWLSHWSFYLALLRQPARPLGVEPLADALRHESRKPHAETNEVQRARYWLARLLERRGDRQEALEGYKTLVSSPEQSLYRIFARWRLARLENDSEPSYPTVARGFFGRFASAGVGLQALPLTGPRVPARAESVPAEPLKPQPWAGASDCGAVSQEVSALAQLGMLDLSQALLRRVRWSKLGPNQSLGCAAVAYAAGDYKLASTLAHRYVARPRTTTATPFAQNLRNLGPAAKYWFPRAYRSIVDAVAAKMALEPALVYAIMKAESHFRPLVSSRVGARGLMQIMPETGARIAKIIGFEGFHPDDLFDPSINIALGAWYLNFLYTYYRGDLVRTIAAYNAGPEAVDRWATQSPDLEIDEFAENIPFSQTHAYVRTVMGYMDSYLVLISSADGLGDASSEGLVINFGPGLAPPLPGVDVF